MNYVVGFIFSQDLDKVLLVRKNRGPVNMSGKLNGIGGKVEEDEFPLNAMIRECKEETGLSLYDWIFYCKLDVGGNIVYFYYIVTDKIYDFKQLEDEELNIYPISNEYLDYESNGRNYTWFNRMANLDYLIPMALNHYKKLDNARSFEIKEIYN